MDEHFTDDELRALRDADPAAGSHAPEPLRERIAEIPGNADDAPVSLDPRREADAGLVPPKARRRWLVPAAAAGAIVAAIGGGYIWGTGGADLGPAPVPMAVATGTPQKPAAPIGGFSGADAGDTGGSADGAARQSMPGMALQAETSMMAADSMYSYGYGPYWGSFSQQRFILPTFDTTPSQASVYAVDARVQYSAEDAARMAAVLGLTGDTRESEGGGGWVVGDYPGARFELTLWGGADAGYSSGVVDPWSACHNAISPGYDLEKGGQKVWEAYNLETERCLKDTPMPTEEQARDALSLFLAATGVDEEATRITVTPDTMSRTMMATAARVVGSNETEIVTHVGVSAQGMLSGYGPTGSVVSLGDYPIVSPAEGASRLNDPAYSPRLVSWPDREGDYPEYIAPTAPPEVPGAGSRVPWGITEREIVSARLGLALLYGDHGEQFLAPAYEFTADDDTVWSVIALAEGELDTATPDHPFYGGWW